MYDLKIDPKESTTFVEDKFLETVLNKMRKLKEENY